MPPLPHILNSTIIDPAKRKKCYNWDGGLVGADSGLSSHRIFPSHAQNFLEFWKRPADLAIIPQVNLQGRIESVLKFGLHCKTNLRNW